MNGKLIWKRTIRVGPFDLRDKNMIKIFRDEVYEH
jgi:hypothetical protein